LQAKTIQEEDRSLRKGWALQKMATESEWEKLWLAALCSTTVVPP
jgi:hypothetical protein